ncbi:MAG TPA: nuclear transport factor 2 family protein [Pseudomonadales bacterium]|nr:nuclear transport factor 2 family protein [Pseudomonadales bacterium]
MNRLNRQLSTILSCTLLLAPALASEPARSAVTAEHEAALSEADRDAFVEILAAIEEGWETAAEAPFRRHFTDAPQAHFVESGGADVGLDHLLEHHVVPEGDALADLELDLEPIEMHAGERFGWVLARSEFRAVVRDDGRQIHSRGYETVVLERRDGTWVVLHSHGSSRPVK